MKFKFKRFAPILALAGILASRSLFGQIIDGPIQQQPDPNLAAGQSDSGVYVRDSAVALDQVALAQRMERAHEWGKSAEIYQQILEKYRDRVVPSHSDAQGAADQYTSVASTVIDHLRRWPPDGLAVYRARYEVPAQTLLAAKPGDLQSAHEVFSQYFVTATGKQAGLQLLDAYLELGDFAAASWIGQELLNHPDIAQQKPMVLFEVGIAAHLSGDSARAVAALDELNNQYAKELGTIRGTDVVLSKDLALELANIKVASFTAEGDSWNTTGGDASRGKVSPASARAGARLYSLELAQPDFQQAFADASQRQLMIKNDEDARKNGGALGVMPVVDGSELFFQDNAHVYAIDLNSGSPLAAWTASYPSQNGAYTLAGAWPMPTGHQMALTVTPTLVLGILNQADASSSSNANPSDARLLCLDRATGKERWNITSRDFSEPALKTAAFGGSPLVVGDNLYVSAHVAKPNGYEDCYAICLSAATGSYRWSCFVASALSGSPMVMSNGQVISSDPSTHLSYASGRLYVASNVGAIAAVDAYNGTIQWLNIYREQDDVPDPNLAMGRGFGGRMGGGGFGGGGFGGGGFYGAPPPPSAPAGPWTDSPPIVSGGDVFLLPRDGKYVLVYDAGSGQLLNRLSKDDVCKISSELVVADADLRKPDTLLGVIPTGTFKDYRGQPCAQLIVLATPDRICMVDWRKYTPEHQRSSMFWSSQLVNEQKRSAIRGRAFVTADDIYVSAFWAMGRISNSTGSLMEWFPPGGVTWSDEDGPGNLVVSNDHVVIATDRHVNVYTALSAARARLDQAQAAAPDDAEVRLHYADVMFVAGQVADATTKLDEAIGLLGGSSAMQSGAARHHVFVSALQFASKLSRNRNEQSRINGFFDRAAQAADSPSDQVRYRLARAYYARFGPQQDLPLAVRMYQEILGDVEMRSAPVSDMPEPTAVNVRTDEPTGSKLSQAGICAQQAIASIVKDRSGAAAYEPYQVKARELFEKSRDAGDAPALIAVSQAYPNSDIAHVAMIAAAARFEATSDHEQATQVLRQMYNRSPESDRLFRLTILESLARNYAVMDGRAEAAASRLQQGASLDPMQKLQTPLIVGSQTVPAGLTLREAAVAVRRYVAQLPLASLPDFKLPTKADRVPGQRLVPLRPAPELTVSDVSVLVPTRGAAACNARQDSGIRTDRLVTWTAQSGVSIYDVAPTQRIASCPKIESAPLACTWVNSGKQLLVWTRTTLNLLDGETAAPLWTINLALLAHMEPMQRPTAPTVATDTPAPEARNVQVVVINGRRMLVQNGNVLEIMRPTPAQARPGIVSAFISGITSVQAHTGNTSPEHESWEKIIPCGQCAVFSTSSGRTGAVNLLDGSILWQTRPSSHGGGRLLANPAFTVLATADESLAQLIVLDTRSGDLLAQRTFSLDGAYPINVALGSDDTLAWTSADRLTIYDLNEAGHDPNLTTPKFEIAAPQQSPKLFSGMTGSSQLILRGTQVLAMCDGGHYVRVYSTQTGEASSYKQAGADQAIPMLLATDNPGPDVQMAVSGNYLYTYGANSINGYNIAQPEAAPWQALVKGRLGQLRLFAGLDHIVVLSGPFDIGEANMMNLAERAGSTPTPVATSWVMDTCWRKLINSAESGVWEYSGNPVKTPPDIFAWQAIDGGFAYLASDRQLHILIGTRPSNATLPIP